jgi:CheY-like chemotaxis protein
MRIFELIPFTSTQLYKTIPRLYARNAFVLHLLSMDTNTNRSASSVSTFRARKYGELNVTGILPTVLCVDDDAQQRGLLRAVLEHFGFHVMAAKSAIDALEIAQWLPFDVALLDYELPDMTGAQLAHELRGIEPSAAIILLSGHPHIRAGELIYVDAHIVKGSPIDELIDMIHSLTGPPQWAQSLRPRASVGGQREQASFVTRDSATSHGN